MDDATHTCRGALTITLAPRYEDKQWGPLAPMHLQGRIERRYVGITDQVARCQTCGAEWHESAVYPARPTRLTDEQWQTLLRSGHQRPMSGELPRPFIELAMIAAQASGTE